jgi:arginyl-tRNA synthetase
MDPFRHFELEIGHALEALSRAGKLPPGLNAQSVIVELPRDPAYGDLATNAALVLAKQARRAPRELAQDLAAQLRSIEGVAAAEVAGPGFINLKLSPAYWQRALAGILEAGEGYGASNVGGGVRVNIEYVSANPTGPMHVGHTRGAVFGDALANLLVKAGFAVTREYYINDAGVQVDSLARSAHLRYREALGEVVGDIPDGLYPGDYLVPVGRTLAERFGKTLAAKTESEWLPIVREVTVDAMMALIRDDLAALGIKHDVFFSERSLQTTSRLNETLTFLEAKGFLYRGVLEAPKGKAPEDWEPREQTLFRATAFGDDTDRPVLKSDGSLTYFASDIAYHRDKFSRGFLHMIDVLGADHAGYVKRLKAAVEAASEGLASLDVKVCQLVRLFRGGIPVKMSKRAGTFVTLRDVVDEVGAGVVRFIMLFRKNDAPLDFDFEKVLEQSKDNPVFYVQYGHARVSSVMRVAGETFPGLDTRADTLARASFSALTDEAELQLIKLLASYPRQIEQAAAAHEPHRIAFYLYDLASAFHALWNKGKDDPALRFVMAENRGVTMARLGLIRATGLVLASGLRVLGVEPVEEMR